MSATKRILGGAVATAAAAFAATRALRWTAPGLPSPPGGRPARYGWRHAEIFHAATGSGPAALLLHDVYTGASGDEMTSLAARLSDHMTVHVADLPGFGRSGRPPMRFGPEMLFDAVVELVRHAIDRPTLLIGSGRSAAYAVEAAVRLGDMARGVVLLAPPEPKGAGSGSSPALGSLAYQVLRSPFGEAYHHLHAATAWRRHAIRQDLAAEPADLDERAARRHRYARQPGSQWPLWSLWVGDLDWDPRPALARLGAPALVLWSAEARRNPAAPELYRAVRPDLDQRVVPGTGRWPHVDAPDATADRILDWAGARLHPDPDEGGE